mmetsp:Transcript_30054/g.90973  ORF Transcript_30054/g.90973 Transcript_30054/m.90973 type:complete len:251 (+) Transcript_30054:900-1652(+)
MAATRASCRTPHSYFCASSVLRMPWASNQAVCSATSSSGRRPCCSAWASRCALRDLSFCCSIAASKPARSTESPASSAICWVKSTGKPCESYSKKACSPGTTLAPEASKSCRMSPKYDMPRSTILSNAASSSLNTSRTRPPASCSSGKAGPSDSTTTGTSPLKKPGGAPSICLPYRTARRRILLRTYPRPSLDGVAPSATASVRVRAWSTMTRYAVSRRSASSPPSRPRYGSPPTAEWRAARRGENTSVS